MNPILELKGTFSSRKALPGGGSGSIKSEVSVKKLTNIGLAIEKMIQFWSKQDVIDGALITLYYDSIIAKSNRATRICDNTSVVGVKFNNNLDKHLITHFVTIEKLKESKKILKYAIEVMNKYFNGIILRDDFNKNKVIEQSGIYKDIDKISKSEFQGIIKEISYIENIDIEITTFNPIGSSIITLYNTKQDIRTLLRKININISLDKLLDGTTGETVLLNEEEIKQLQARAPFLISMGIEDFSLLDKQAKLELSKNEKYFIEEPTNEPIIGVIDTLFDKRVYFSNWVEYHEIFDTKSISTDTSDFNHGTAVSSIIVDGPALNPRLDDDCGRFRVRHFGVSNGKGMNSFWIIQKIKEIVRNNRDIKVWNLSLGSIKEISINFVSAEAAAIDQIQSEYDVTFVISGTNGKSGQRIGSPADSINSVVVNAVDFDENSTSYTRSGPVLSYFIKPDVSYYGGSQEGGYINVVEPLGLQKVAGTSFAAPWIARKLSFLIDKLNMSREVAKAILIDSAIGWHKRSFNQRVLIGHGVVPIKIQDIIKSPIDEIKFIVKGTSNLKDTYNYNFPIPLYRDKYPFKVKATMCYFTKCFRNQGVDYTETELGLSFGRLKDEEGTTRIKPINDDKQYDVESKTTESRARKEYRKWDNVKHIQEKMSSRSSATIPLSKNKLWGMKITSTPRTDQRQSVNFAVVVTLKEN